MKKFFPSVVGMATLLMVCACVTAQTTINKLSQEMAVISIHKPVTPAGSGVGKFSRINIKAVRYFMTTYPEVSDETWEVFKGGFIAKFFSNSVETKNFFDQKGNWLHSIKRYDESKLQKRVRAAIKSNYYDYMITQVQEINNKRSAAEPVYLVHLQFGATFKLIWFCNDEMEEI